MLLTIETLDAQPWPLYLGLDENAFHSTPTPVGTLQAFLSGTGANTLVLVLEPQDPVVSGLEPAYKAQGRTQYLEYVACETVAGASFGWVLREIFPTPHTPEPVGSYRLSAYNAYLPAQGKGTQGLQFSEAGEYFQGYPIGQWTLQGRFEIHDLVTKAAALLAFHDPKPSALLSPATIQKLLQDANPWLSDLYSKGLVEATVARFGKPAPSQLRFLEAEGHDHEAEFEQFHTALDAHFKACGFDALEADIVLKHIGPAPDQQVADLFSSACPLVFKLPRLGNITRISLYHPAIGHLVALAEQLNAQGYGVEEAAKLSLIPAAPQYSDHRLPTQDWMLLRTGLALLHPSQREMTAHHILGLKRPPRCMISLPDPAFWESARLQDSRYAPQTRWSLAEMRAWIQGLAQEYGYSAEISQHPARGGHTGQLLIAILSQVQP